MAFFCNRQTLEPAFGSRPQHFHNCRYLHSLYTGIKLYCLAMKAHGHEQLAPGCYLTVWQLG